MFIFLFFPPVLAKASKKILKRSSYPYLISDRKENDFNISLLNVYIILVNTLIRLGKFPSFFTHVSLMNENEVLNAFSSSIEMILSSFFNLLIWCINGLYSVKSN